MKKAIHCLVVLLVFYSMSLYAAIASPASQTQVLTINGGIGPSVASYITTRIQQANQQPQVKLIVLRIDTPGGLNVSMRQIIQAILASRIPVIGFVAPSGARAASAGTFILYATAIAAMAPGTNIGAATPINLLQSGKAKDSKMEQKLVNDAKAYIRTLAQLHARNAEFAQSAVDKGASLSAKEALQQNVINIVANNVPDLLHKINGRPILLHGKKILLNTQHLHVHYVKPTWAQQFLITITDPTVAYLLLMAGLFCIAVEFFYPGAMIPGVVGAICLLIAIYALHMLPVNYIGLSLIVLGIAFVIAELFISSYGVLGIGGVVALFVGSLMLFSSSQAGFGIAREVIYGVPILFGLTFLGLLAVIIKDRRRPPISNMAGIVGKVGTVVLMNGQPWLKCHGELLQIDDPIHLNAGEQVRVVRMEGARVVVAKQE